jgi:hypothetical protein
MKDYKRTGYHCSSSNINPLYYTVLASVTQISRIYINLDTTPTPVNGVNCAVLQFFKPLLFKWRTAYRPNLYLWLKENMHEEGELKISSLQPFMVILILLKHMFEVSP